jgi:sortase A
LARVFDGLGRVLIWTGSIVLLFVAYQLWGTNIAEARAQDDLQSEFEDRLAGLTAEAQAVDADEPTRTAATITTEAPVSDEEPVAGRPTTTTITTTAIAPPPPPDDGEAVARIVIPAIDVDKIVVEGTSRSDLRTGPGHYPGTPMPGQPGNAAIAGHRTTYGAPFNRVDELQPGDEILVTTLQGSFTYEVSDLQIVSPSQVEVVEDQGDDRLTLTSCHPQFSARQRIVVSALLVDDPAPPPPPQAITVGADGDDHTGEEAAAIDVDTQLRADPELEVLDGEPRGPIGPVIVWGAVAFAVWLAFHALGRRWRRWPAYLLGAPVFAVALFVFFEAIAGTLPTNY